MTFDNTVAQAQNLPALFFTLAAQRPDSFVYEYPEYDGAVCVWKKRAYQEVAERICRIAEYLKTLGITQGSTVAIICGTRPEWMELDIAILSLGAITISIYPSLPAGDIGYILYDSKAQFVIAENEEQLQKLISIDAAPTHIPARENFTEETVQLSLGKIITIEDTSPYSKRVELSSILSASSQGYTPPDSLHSIARDTIASLVYTSGTTGPSKGVIQTHGNHLANIYQAMKTEMFATDGDIFLFLPLAHSFARLIGYLIFLTPALGKLCGVADKKSSKVDLVRVAQEIREGSPNVLPSVPRLFEKIKTTLEERSTKSGLQPFLLRTTLKAAQDHFKAVAAGHAASPLTSLLYVLTTPIRKKVKRGIFGNRFMHAISGGAKLPADVNTFFWGLGIEIYEGYGLTETCVATNVNRRGMNKIGSVGPALEGVETQIAPDGEILFKGPNVTKGYWNRPQATAESWDAQGWFHTGDIGHLDDDGFLFITDRKKDLIVTAGGKKIPPLKVENLITNSPFIAQALYAGDGKPYCVALVTLNTLVVKEFLAKKGKKMLEQFHTDPEVVSLIEKVKDQVNQELSSFEAIKKISIIPDEFTIDNGLLTPTMKMKRKVVLERYRAYYDALY